MEKDGETEEKKRQRLNPDILPFGKVIKRAIFVQKKEVVFMEFLYLVRV